MQFSKIIPRLSSETPRGSVSSERSISTPKKTKMSSAEAYWSDPVMAAQFGSSQRPSISSERRSSEKTVEKKAHKISAAEAYWSDPVMAAQFGDAPRPAKTEKKVKKISAAEAYWSDPTVSSYGFGSIMQPARI